MTQNQLRSFKSTFKDFFDSMKNLLRNDLDTKIDEIKEEERMIHISQSNEPERRNSIFNIRKEAKIVKALLSTTQTFEKNVDDIYYSLISSDQEEVYESHELQENKHDIKGNNKEIRNSSIGKSNNLNRDPWMSNSRDIVLIKKPPEKTQMNTLLAQMGENFGEFKMSSSKDTTEIKKSSEKTKKTFIVPPMDDTSNEQK